jgi:hypothetical protein
MGRKSDAAVAKRSPRLTRVILNVLYKLGSAATAPWSATAIWKSLSKAATKDPRVTKVLLGFVALFAGTGGRLRLQNGHASVFMPLWIYDTCVQLNFVLNWAIGAATFCLNVLPFQTAPDWNTNIDLSPTVVATAPEALAAKEMASMQQSIIEDRSRWLKEHNLIQLFDSLPPAQPEMMRGKAFRGRIIRCGRSLDLVDLFIIQPLSYFGVKWGKRYRTQYVGDPLCFTLLERLHMPLPAWGNVGMHGVNYRGRQCATMAYDCQPWHDMFAVLDDGAASGKMKFLGLWCHRQKSGGWFTLTELPDVDVTL